MDFSVIVPCFNNERYLRVCLEALFAQTYPRDRYEVILVDNNSTDRSLEIARDFPGLMVLQEEVQGSYSARNRGLRNSRGKMLAFTDSDCEACPTWLQTMAASLSEPGAVLALGSRRHAAESFGLTMAADYEAQRTEYVCGQSDLSLYYGHTGNLAVHREAFERCGLFMTMRRGADTVFVTSVLRAYGPGSVRFVREARVRHLEIHRVSDWYRKLRTYGRSSTYYAQWSHTRPLGLLARLRVMWRTIARNRYSWFRAPSLFLLLAVGVLVFGLGRIAGFVGKMAARQTAAPGTGR